jgi:hypothetical protein
VGEETKSVLEGGAEGPAVATHSLQSGGETKPKSHSNGLASNYLRNAVRHVRKEHVYSTIAYLLVTLAVLAPVIAHFTTYAPGTGGDTYQNLWDIWWVVHAVAQGHSIWSTNLLFYPLGTNLIYQTMSPIGAIVTAPFQAISLPAAYNAMLVLGFVISGLCMYVLAKYITNNAYASFIAGLVFAFSAFHVAQAYAHIDWIVIGWIPLALYFFMRMLNGDGKYLSAVGLGITFVLTVFMGDIEQGLMVVLLLFAVLVAYAIGRGTRRLLLRRRFWVGILIALIVAFVAGAWGFLPILHGITQSGGLQQANYLNTISNNILWSDPLASFFVPSYFNGIFNSGGNSNYLAGTFSYNPTERVAYIGYTVIALAAYGMYRRRRLYKLWLGIAIVFGWLTLGPYLQAGGTVTHIPGLYYLYKSLPLFNIIREPDRFYAVFSIATAVLAALGLKELLNAHAHSSRNRALLITGVVAALFIIEAPGIGLTHAFAQLVSSNASVPALYSQLAVLPGNFSVLLLPALADQSSALPNLYPGKATYFSAISGKPLVGGEVGRPNSTQELLLDNVPLIVQAQNLETSGNFTYPTPANENLTAESILSLYNYNTAFIAVNKNAYTSPELLGLESYLSEVFGKPVYNDNTTVAFSTASAINSSVYRTYAVYPYLPDLYPNYYAVNGTERLLWLASTYGCSSTGCYIPFLVYAPYPNATQIARKIASGSVYSINTTVSFEAMSLAQGTSKLTVGIPTSNSTYRTLAAFNVTPELAGYSFNTRLVSGPFGNSLLFIQALSASGSETVAITNVTFARA